MGVNQDGLQTALADVFDNPTDDPAAAATDMSQAIADNVDVSGDVQVPELGGGWDNYGSGFQTAGYYLDSAGRVHLQGLLGGGTISAVIFTLDEGFRPANRSAFAVTSGTTEGRCDVTADGEVIAFAGISGHFSLDGVSFRAA